MYKKNLNSEKLELWDINSLLCELFDKNAQFFFFLQDVNSEKRNVRITRKVLIYSVVEKNYYFKK